MVEHHPVHNSEVYLLGLPKRPSVPPPSPPSPLTPSAEGPSIPIGKLCLDDTEPLASDDDGNNRALASQRLFTAIHVINTEATSLWNLVRLYETDRVAGAGFDSAVQAVTRQGTQGGSGKLVLTGVGKSGHIAKKLVATFNSLGVRAAFLHPTEALHGDLGMVGPRDTVMFITFSGRTPELLALLPHIDPTLPTIVLTSHRCPDDCELVRCRPGMVLLPAPIHETEAVSFGVAAPTTSTTTALAVGDALAVAAAQELHTGSVPSVFAQNHPGGAIGAALQQTREFLTQPPLAQSPNKPQRVRDLAVPLREIPSCRCGRAALVPTETRATTIVQEPEPTGADVLKAAFDSSWGPGRGWVRVPIGDDADRARDGVVSPGRVRALEVAQLPLGASAIPGLVVGCADWIVVRADTPVPRAAEWVRDVLLLRNRNPPRGVGTDEQFSILAVVHEDGSDVVGVLEARRLLELESEEG
ncbi:hypothetical protein DL764_008377 [Monosporascus ibericus]|uniref:SIS domain-containing protein n=1 Tax=Monosporascus ibericus TaxID=155417 RepID=A0A4Q4T0F7_9PEZI|nr:hypothetical protein DL764_008377 [Monosporascus ibericus]